METTTQIFGSFPGSQVPADAKQSGYSWWRQPEGQPFRLHSCDGISWLECDGQRIASAVRGEHLQATYERFGAPQTRLLSYEGAADTPSPLLGTLSRELSWKEAWRFCLAAKAAGEAEERVRVESLRRCYLERTTQIRDWKSGGYVEVPYSLSEACYVSGVRTDEAVVFLAGQIRSDDMAWLAKYRSDLAVAQ